MRKISIESVIPEHQKILEAKAALFNTVMDASRYAIKGSDTVEFPLLAAANGEVIDATAGTISGEDLNYTQDSLVMNKASARGFMLKDNEEEENYLNGLEDGIKTSMSAIARGIDSAIYTTLMTTTNTFTQTTDIQADFLGLLEDLDGRNVPLDELFYACGAGDYAKLLKVRDFVAVDARGSEDRIGTGFIGTLYGVSIVRTNIVSAKSCMYHRGAAAVAKQGELKMKVEDKAYEMLRKHALWQKFGTKLLNGGALVTKLI